MVLYTMTFRERIYSSIVNMEAERCYHTQYQTSSLLLLFYPEDRSRQVLRKNMSLTLHNVTFQKIGLLLHLED
jgi:hypothetical protein